MSWLKKNGLYIAWATSFLGALGSLYFSNVLNLPPCILCWFQRIFMYPLIIILAVGILRKDQNVDRYALPLSIIGLAIAAYHNLLYYKILPESAAPCLEGVSCTTRQVSFFGFIDIPLLSLGAFIIITAALLLHRRYINNEQRS